MNYIAKIEIKEGLWILTLKGGAVIEGTSNLAHTIGMLEKFVWPQPKLSREVHNVYN